MKHFTVLAVITGLMLMVGFSMLASSFRGGFRFGDHAPNTIFAAPVAPVVAPPVVVAQTTAPERVMVGGDVVDRLTEENATLKARVKELESVRPTTAGELAVVLGVKEADLTAALDRSQLIPDAAALAEVVRHAGAQVTWQALQEESKLYRSLADFKLKNPAPTTNSERPIWHSTTFVPFYSERIDCICQRLYQLQLPSTVVEPFRHRLNEGI
jgi:hypothetical protein